MDPKTDYSKEPTRPAFMKVNKAKPFNAEPPEPKLVDTFHTPVDIFY
jgi:hypothetical protein